ncbi:carbohydrate porin [Methylocapsa sp. D3K7]|uniref:carbohydrate porin n=1 Tax=Methylocapsa sp. D3K7 TaxID=3041435 RepID=UPI00244EE4DF|nr:carbohydrate porin [Methylocapsa sp. D3K7]WGJ14741.1 carbohydrate porin [Methylocapsa sp. D3K7]
MRLNGLICTLFATGWFALFGIAHARDAIGNSPEPENEALPPNLQPSIASSIPVLAQFKNGLLDYGYNLQLNYTGEVLGNPTGGVKQGATNEGLFEMSVDGDLNKIAGWNGATFHINAYVIHGRGLSTYNLFDISTVSGIEARPTTRLFEAWGEQQLLNGLLAVRIGQLSADTEFFISEYAALYIDGTFGWPDSMRADLPSNGGPNYPLATPGVRLKLTPSNQITFLAALYNGDPSGAGFTGLGEILDPAGINFRLRDPPFLLCEAQYRYSQSSDSAGLRGTIKLGAWHHFGEFDDLRFAANGQSLANPLVVGNPLVHSGNTGIYGVIDQMIWRRSGEDQTKGIGIFARASAAPSDRNVVDVYFDGGINFIGLWDARPDDMFGMAAAYSRISPDERERTLEQAFFVPGPVAYLDNEVSLELTYQAQIIPGLIVQPDFQYIFRPSGGALNPLNPFAGRIPDAAVFGLRTTIKF